jgi:hypothetical protein
LNILGKVHNQTREVITGTAQDDLIYPMGGWDFVDGGAGFDTVVVLGKSTQFKIVTELGNTYIDALSGASAQTERTQLVNVEQVQFTDKTISLLVNDMIKGQPGTDFFDGGVGIDTLVYSGPLEQYTLKKSSARFVVSESTGSDDTDYLTSIERLQFSNAKLALDLDGHAGDAVKIIGSLLGPKFIEDKPLVGIVLGLLDQNYTKTQIASLGLSTPLYQSLAGSASNEDFVKYVFNNVVGRPPKPDELNTYLSMLSQGSTQAELAVLAGDTELNALRIDLVGLVQHGIAYL